MKNNFPPFKLKTALQKAHVSGQYSLAELEKELIRIYENYLKELKAENDDQMQLKVKMAYQIYSKMFNELIVDKVGK